MSEASVIAERANLFAEVIVYAQRFVASNNATHSCDKSHNRWLCPLRSISANASACFSLRLRSAACRGTQTQCRLPTKHSFVSSPLPHEKRQPFRIVFFGADNRTCSERSERNSGTGEFIRGSDRLRSTICCKQQCYAFVRQIAQSLAMSAALDFRKCKRLLLSSLAVSCVQGHTNAVPFANKT